MKDFDSKTVTSLPHRSQIAQALRTLRGGKLPLPEDLKAFLAYHATRSQGFKHLNRVNILDELTGVQNRKGMNHEMSLAYESAQSAEYANDTWVGFVDIERMKRFNDTYGHAAGDKLLYAAAQHLVKALKRSDMVFRLSGDEFVLLLHRAGNDGEVLARGRDGSEGIEQRVVQAYRTATANIDPQGITGLSVGIAPLDPKVPIERSIIRADGAMYHAKFDAREGKGNFVHIYDSKIDYFTIQVQVEKFSRS